MVLDDASPQATDGFQDGGAAENKDPYFTRSDPTSPFAKYYPLQVKPELIVRPDIFTSALGFLGRRNWEKRFTEETASRIENVKVLIERYPTQEELDAFVQHSSRALYQARVGIPLGFAAGAVFTWKSATRKSEELRTIGLHNPAVLWEYIKVVARADPPAFRQAVVATGAKLFGWTVLGATLSSVYATWNFAANSLTDSRLDRFRQDVRNQKPEDIQKRRLQSVSERYQQVRRAREQEQQAGGLAKSPVTTISQDTYGGVAADTYDVSQPKDQTRTFTDRPSTKELPLDRTRIATEAQRRTTTPSDSSSGYDFFDDDASPIASEYRTDTTTSQQQQQRQRQSFGGSAWERIRQQNINMGPTQQTRPQAFRGPREPQYQQQQDQYQSGTTNAADMSASYAKEERDKQREREQAQRDFDRMLENERRISADDPAVTGSETSGGQQGGRRGWGWNR
ncbi:hypothetical protein VTN00DRAFT_3810 [Thermoascus crustaceus]|uniref:uncharacterized protein n=1 Tax=Thermoascus crustaceus TaxID=5088 RepID=UPI0037432785